MKKELESKFIVEFPSFFRDIYGDPKKTCMAFGIDFGDGWYDVFYELCSKLKEEDNNNFYFTQLKEKWGLMTVYCAGATEKQYKLIDKYEHL